MKSNVRNVDIAVLMTCHNRKAKTLECLRTLFSQNGLNKLFNLKVFLVDDNSNDGTSMAVKETFPAVTLIKGCGNLYWNRGMNLAWHSAISERRYDFYLWLNDDTSLFRDALTEMISCIKLAKRPAIICGAVSSPKDNSFTYGGISKRGVALIPNGALQECYIINGNCVLVSNEAFELVGNIDPIFPHAIGDHDFGLRLLKAGGHVFTTRKYIANCERNDKLPKWCYGSTPLKERIQALYSPLGNSHPKYYFIYERRHFGILVALKHYLSIHLRVLIPSLWK